MENAVTALNKFLSKDGNQDVTSNETANHTVEEKQVTGTQDQQAAIHKFLSKDGEHDTTVHETVNAPITKEHVTRTQHEQATKVVDREIHQDHFHTSVQPVKDKEVLPTQHSHKTVGVEERDIDHSNGDSVNQRLAAEKAEFKNTREVGELQRTEGSGKTITGERVHHHVHEQIQPVIEKEVVQPSVVHTTIPVHEVQHNEPERSETSTLPAVPLSEFKSGDGSVSGSKERSDAFAGGPKATGGSIGGQGAAGTTSLTEKDRNGSNTTDDRSSRDELSRKKVSMGKEKSAS